MMLRKRYLMALITFFFVIQSAAQTTNGSITGRITDPSGAVIPAAEIDVTNEGTNVTRGAKTDATGSYIIPQLPPGLYSISVKKEGFATQIRTGVQLEVNQSATLDFKLTVSSTRQTVQVTGAPPALNTTSATLQDVVQHQAIVDLPLNGREFTGLALLTPGAAPVENSQQRTFNIALGAGGISPSVNGQRGEENNFTMDGLLNNQLFMNTYVISPPPDALQEFNVQSHITNAQFAISSGANINVVTRSGTNAFHGSIWEFNRNAAVAARNFFAANRLPYNQNQYGFYFGGPVILPHFSGKDNTWFAGYWEGYRSGESLPSFADVPTAAERAGDFSAFLGPQVGTDSLGRPEYQNEIYDPATSRPDPNNPAVSLRDPFPGNIIPTSRINPASALLLGKYFPLPNLNVPAGVFPNLEFSAPTSTKSDNVGLKIDHHFHNGDTVFGRLNRSNRNLLLPQALPTYVYNIQNYGKVAGFGYTHLFGGSTVLSLHYGYTHMDLVYAANTPGLTTAFDQSLNYHLNDQSTIYRQEPPGVGMSNGITGTGFAGFSLGPERSNQYDADLTKVIGHHTLGVGGMYYHIKAFQNITSGGFSFTQNATSQDATPGPTGFGPASFLLGLPDSGSGYLGDNNMTALTSWYGLYVQDQWRATKKLTITAGMRYDYVEPPLLTKIVSGLDFYTGQFLITEPFLPLFPKATAPRRYYNPQKNGWEPRFGIAYRVSHRTVIRSAFAMMDEHNRMVQTDMGTISQGWPTALTLSLSQENRGLPNLFINNLPGLASFLDPLHPIVGQCPDPNMKIPYAIEYNFGIEQQLPSSMVLSLGYVGSVDRHQMMQDQVNGARIPGPGSLASRGQPYPQYNIFPFDTNVGMGSYNALQAELRKTLSSGLSFIASYTWSKSLDTTSDPYNGQVQNFYDMRAEWGPSDYNVGQLAVLSGIYALPVGSGKQFLSSSRGIVQALSGNWNVASIISLHSGLAFQCVAGTDVANVGTGTQRCDEIGNPYGGAGFPSTQWLNPASFTTIPFTWGTEGRNGLTGPSYKDVDFSLFKTFPLFRDRANFQIRGDFFNLFNHTNFNNPVNNLQSSSFGKIVGTSLARVIQFAAKLTF
jgi:Carboxypeptidase regulatory-like domain/TonB dependent receptor-like, beta-barrel